MMGHPYPGLWNFKHHPWLKDMHDSTDERRIGQKSAQVGFTEWALNTTFHFLDIKRMDVLYVLPNTRPDATDFSSGRFDKALELSKHLRQLFSDVQNVGHKRAGSTNLYIRGSNSPSGLKSIPVGLLILDELDEILQENIPLATERLSGQLERNILMLSTPTIPDFGINFYFNTSSQDVFTFPCPCCSKYIELRFPDSLKIIGEDETDPRMAETHLVCHECGGVLPHEDKIKYLNKGIWKSAFHGRTDRGFYLNQLYSMNLHPSTMAKAYFQAQKDPAAEQQYYNSKGGVPHIVAGARLTQEMVNDCIGQYRKVEDKRGGLNTLGVDVGRNLHCEVDNWELDGRAGNDVNSFARCKVLSHFDVKDFEQLDKVMSDYNISFCVIDAQPETRKALEFANRFYGRVKLCRYPMGVNGRNISPSPEEEHIVNVNRTSWLDLALGRFRNKTITIPMDTTLEYKNHITAQVRIPKKDNNGNPVTRYETPGNRPDHYGHARVYAEVALPFAVGLGVAGDIRS